MIPREFLQRIREIEIRTNRMAQETLAGAYHSVFRGRGIDFEELREYQPGDEVRSIDWNVTARTGKPHVRRYREERELSLVLMLDVSASGSLGSGTQTKREVAAEIASVLAFSALKNNDRVSLILFSSEIELFVPPGKGRAHVFHLIREILFFRAQQQRTSIRQAIHYVNQVFPRRAVIFLISDFLDRGYEDALKVASVRHDLIALNVYDERERVLPDVGWVSLEDAETGELIEVNTHNPRVREAFACRSAARAQDLRASMSRAGTDLLEVATSAPYHQQLRTFFEQRAFRRRR